MRRDGATPAEAGLASSSAGLRAGIIAMTKEERRFEVAIDDMTLGPYGVGRRDGKAILVANAAPGDLLQVSVTESHRDYTLARLDTVVRGGPERRDAPCVFLPRCGGCDWQQMTYPEQVAAKGRLIALELQRALGLELDPRALVTPAPAEFGYRSRLRLKVRGNGALGFFEQSSNRLVEIDRCLVAGQDLSFEPARKLAHALPGRCEEIEIVKSAPDRRQVLIGYLRGRMQAADSNHAGRIAADEEAIAGIVLRAGTDRVVLGDVAVTIELEPGMRLCADADAFSQVNHACNRALIAAVMEQAAIEPGVTVLDLFCGAGNFSLPAAKRGGRVLGVDADAVAIGAAQRNAQSLGLDARFAAMEAQGMTPFLLRAGYRPQVVILDPPRSGARHLMQTITALDAARVVYVSCDVATLARDLRMLSSNGYVVSSVKAFDFFPNTHHCEVLALLT
jgi:23S rRNA (uracil1939-C5)-methyltransferase